jgi:hypothetical protein
MYWNAGCALPMILNSQAVRPNLSPAEVDFLREYDDLVKAFKEEFKDISGGDDLGGEPFVHLKVFLWVMVLKCMICRTSFGRRHL